MRRIIDADVYYGVTLAFDRSFEVEYRGGTFVFTTSCPGNIVSISG